jgi:hypothetical protein
VRMVFGTEAHTTVGRRIGGSETPMPMANGKTEGDGGTKTKGMQANATASTVGTVGRFGSWVPLGGLGWGW